MIITGILAKISRWHRNTKAIRQLGELDDRTLADLGIARSQIPGAVAGLQRERLTAEANAQLG